MADEKVYSVEFHLNDPDLPPEAMRDCMHPPRESTVVHCIHCHEEYDSWRMVYRVTARDDGSVHGFWCCGIPGCDGAGFQCDIFPVDPNFVPDDDQPQGHWVSCDEDDEDGFDEDDISTHDDDCQCELCEEFRAETAEWERSHPKPAPTPTAEKTDENDPEVLNRKTAEEDRRRINAAMASLRKPDERIPLDDLLPDGEGDQSGSRDVVTPEVMAEIEKRMGLGAMTSSTDTLQPPQHRRADPVPLPANWRELLAKHDRLIHESGAAGDEDIPF